MDKGRHQEMLARVERELEEVLDDTAGCIGHREILYRVATHEAKAAVKEALKALERIRSTTS